jgi:hypothetical protein
MRPLGVKDGVKIEGVGSPAAENRVEGNFIGTDVTGACPSWLQF